MIWLGRLLTVPIGVVFFLLLLLTLVVLRVNGTFLDPDYYTEELSKANIYEFVLVDLLTSAIDEGRELRGEDLPQGLGENPLVTPGLSTEEIVSSINRAIPPEYLQGLVEQPFDQFGKYLTGERDEFTVTYRAGEQVETMVSEIKDLARKADAYNLLYDEVLVPRIEDSVDLKLPLGVEVSSARLVGSARRTAPPEWVQAQVEYVLDETTPYLVGKRDTFEINIQLADRVEIALEEVKALLREADAYELLYSEVVEPQLIVFLGESVALPFGVTVTDDEVLDALRTVAPPEWVRQQAETLIDDASPYLMGKSESFSTEISLEENKRLASGVIADLVDARLTDFAAALPVCTSASELQAALARITEGLLPCIPPNTETSAILNLLGIDVASEVERFLLQPIPDTIQFDEPQLRSALVLAGAGDNLDRLDEVREILRDGWTYTQDDLRGDLIKRVDDGAVETLEDIRAFLADGWTYTEADFRDDLSKQDSGALGTVDAIGRLDTGRDVFKLSRTYRSVIWLPLVLLLVSIGFLGGRGWSGRVAYAAAFLLVSAGIIFLIFGPGYNAFAKSGPIYDAAGVSDLDELRQEALSDITQDADGGDFPDTSRLAANKIFDIMESLVDGFASGIAKSSLSLAIIGLVALAAAIFWSAITSTISRYMPEVGRRRLDWFRKE